MKKTILVMLCVLLLVGNVSAAEVTVPISVIFSFDSEQEADFILYAANLKIADIPGETLPEWNGWITIEEGEISFTLSALFANGNESSRSNPLVFEVVENRPLIIKIY